MMENKEEGFTKASKEEMDKISYTKKLVFVKLKEDFITNRVNGRYFLERYNMMAEQIQSENIKEKIDGCIKTMDYMKAEAVMTKRQAFNAFRNAHFGEVELKKKHGLTDKDITEIEVDLYDGKIIREEYDDEKTREGDKV